MMLKSILSILVLVFLITGCSSEPKDYNTPEGLFSYAKEFEDADRYDMAITKYNEVKNKFPYSNLATESELAVANVYFKKEAFPEAQVSYQNFRDLHPKHSKIDFVVYRIAMSYYMQLPDSGDRDLSLANDAIYHFDELLRLYPKSQYSIEAKKNREDSYLMLGEKELYIADYYLKKEQHEAALRRYESLLQKYPGIGYDPRAHLGAARASHKLNNSEKQKYHTQMLIKKYSQSDEKKTAESEGLL